MLFSNMIIFGFAKRTTRMKFLLSTLFSILTFTLSGQEMKQHRMDTIWVRADQYEQAWVSLGNSQNMQTIPFSRIREKVLSRATTYRSAVLCYRVRPKDNLFRISRIYLGLKEQEVMAMNSLKSAKLDIGQVLTIGYLDPLPFNDQAPKEIHEILDGLWVKPAETDSVQPESLRSPMDAYLDLGLEIQKEKGVAYWNRAAEDYSQYFVLHPKAKVNSIMEVTNPMNGRSVHAKVVSKIPENAYTRDITLVVSPAVAKHLGVLDPRFYVVYQYIR